MQEEGDVIYLDLASQVSVPITAQSPSFPWLLASSLPFWLSFSFVKSR